MKPSSPTVILHIGTHKTGSTSIQQYLTENASKYAAHGVLWIKDSYNLPNLINRLASQIERKQLIQDCRRNLESLSKVSEMIIFSSEGFSGSPSKMYSNNADIVNFCQNLFKGYNVKVVVYLRRQDLFYESYYTQRIQEGYTETLEEFLSILPLNEIRWDEVLNNFTSAFGKENLIVRPYDRSILKGNDIVEDFLTIANLNHIDQERNTPAWTNQSYSLAALKIARTLNGTLSKEQQKTLRKILQKSNPKQPGDSFMILPRLRRIEMMQHYEAFNKSIADSFWSGNEHLSFDASTATEIDYVDNTNNEELIRVIFKVLLSLTSPNQ